MQWQNLNREISALIPENAAPTDHRPLIYIDVADQRLHFIHKDGSQNKSYPVSTAAKGLGNRIDSHQTPSGLHRIKDKIGDGQPAGMVFKGRKPTGDICSQYDNRDEDEITSRILWLDGLQPGFNQGGDCDSFERYIYIHGTSDEQRIGQPVSIGCIRMNNVDVIELFDEVLVNDLVFVR